MFNLFVKIILVILLSFPLQVFAEGEPYMMVLIDTSSSMLFDLDPEHAEGSPLSITNGDGSEDYPGRDTNQDGIPNDSRLYIAKQVLKNVVGGIGDIIFGLSRYHSIEDPTKNICLSDPPPYYLDNGIGGCGTTWCRALDGSYYSCIADSLNYLGWELRDNRFVCCNEIDTNNYCSGCNSGDNSCLGYDFNDDNIFDHTDFNGNTIKVGRGADIIVPCEENNQNELFMWVDGVEDWTQNPPNKELRATGYTPLARAMLDIRDYFVNEVDVLPNPPCNRYAVILTDGDDTCEGDSFDCYGDENTLPNFNDCVVVQAASLLNKANITTYIIAFGVADPKAIEIMNQAAKAAQPQNPEATAYIVNDRHQLGSVFSKIVEGAIQYEVCDDADNDCDRIVDEDLVQNCETSCGTGISVCQEGNWTDCSAPIPELEICDGIDNNCVNGIDETVPICDATGTQCSGASCGTDIGICETGLYQCVDGQILCVGGVNPAEEICDNIDNDCDNDVDEELIGGECSENIGECVKGRFICQNGSWICDGVIPQAEVCDTLDNDCDGDPDDNADELCVVEGCQGIRRCNNGVLSDECEIEIAREVCDNIDNDCDGETDESEDVGSPIYCGMTQCGKAYQYCVDGNWTACSVENPETEICDGIDNDCDGCVDSFFNPETRNCVDNVCGTQECVDEICNGMDDDCDNYIDEGLSNNDECGKDEGECEKGKLECVDGLLICTGGRGEAPEICDNKDNDCDTLIDEDLDVECPGASICVQGICSIPCNPEEEFPCPGGEACINVQGTGYFCLADPCEGISCEDTETCANGQCVDKCSQIECDSGTRCKNGLCVADNCYEFGCEEEEKICYQSQCIDDPCKDVQCEFNQFCRNGQCYDVCNFTCDQGYYCVDGDCEIDLCYGKQCTDGSCNSDNGNCSTLCKGIYCGLGRTCDLNTGECVDVPCNSVTCPEETYCEDGTCYVDEDEIVIKILTTGGGGISCSVSLVSTSENEYAFLALFIGFFVFFRRKDFFNGKKFLLNILRIFFIITILFISYACQLDPYCLQCPEHDSGNDDALDISPDVCIQTGQEICNGKDDDCDDEIDEGFDLSSDINNCGICGNQCSLSHAFSDCVNGECVITSCDVGYYNINTKNSDGCEYVCLEQETETNPYCTGADCCDGKDNDCDGEFEEDADLLNDTDNCGDCGNECYYPFAVEACENGNCVFVECEEGYLNLDNDIETGCEYLCTPNEETGGIEVCNNRDDDCNGETDDNIPPIACETECGTGEVVCSNGIWSTCSSGVPGPEICNGEDDDCDDDIDEDFDKDIDPNNCGDCGHSCNDEFPNSISQCVDGDCIFHACIPGFNDLDPDEPGCEYQCEYQGEEGCNGQDDDCNGETDDNLVVSSDYCGSFGVCKNLTPQCRGANGWSCNFPSTYEIEESKCDNLDNDCDGLTDEGFFVGESYQCEVGVGACYRRGHYVCNNSGTDRLCNVTEGQAQQEVCNGIDDNCDNKVDNVALNDMNVVYVNSVNSDIDGDGVVSSKEIGRRFYVFQYEASRPDASDISQGEDLSHACSNAQVLPWTMISWQEAQEACCKLNDDGICKTQDIQASSGIITVPQGWSLCLASDWEVTCQLKGFSRNDDPWAAGLPYLYPYGDEYQPDYCNGNDLNPDCGDSCLLPTGTMEDCTGQWSGISHYDMSGNVHEWTATGYEVNGTFYYEYRGGSYKNPYLGLTCQFDFNLGIDDPEFSMDNIGFRCCYYP